jgi:hypothetical protein
MIPAFRKAFRHLMHVLGIDRAIGFTVLARSWKIFSGLVTVLLISHFLSPAEQGYYYTFASLVALQVVFELGFSFVVLQLAAHESALLHIHSDGEISGNESAHSRLASILQKSVRWYSVAAILMAVVLVAVGFHFFSTHRQSSGTIAWKLPWICVVLAAIFTFLMDPVLSFLEGCGFVAQVARLRLVQAIGGTALGWMAFMQHHGLFAPAAVITGQAITGFAFLASKRHLLLPLLRRNPGMYPVGWRSEIWPFQWRMAISFFCSYFISSLFNPVLFAYRGAVEAGRMGMSLTIATSLGTVAYAWLYTKASPFGNMVAHRDFAALDRIFSRALAQSAALLLGGEVAFMGLFLFAERHFPRLASRMLPVPVFALLLLVVLLNHFVFSEAVYLRAHKQEPFLMLFILVAILTGGSTLLLARLWGATGVTIGYFLCGGVLNFVGATYIFIKKRRLWHAAPADLPSACQDTIV